MGNEVKAYCQNQNCRRELPVNPTGRCPYCGAQGKDFSSKSSVSIGIKVSASGEKIHEYTKRNIPILIISILITVASIIVGCVVGGWLAPLIGVIIAIVNFWLTPKAIKRVREITRFQ